MGCLGRQWGELRGGLKMRQNLNWGVAGVAAFALGAVMIALLRGPSTAPAEQAEGQRIILRGMIRDFRSDHPDFAISPPEGFGHTPSNVSFTINSLGKPAYTGQGFKTASQWRDRNGNPIAPHLYNQSGWSYWTWENAGVGLGNSLTIENNGYIDSWDSSQGTYLDTQGQDALVAMNTGDLIVAKNSLIAGTLLLGPGEDPSIVSEGGQITGNAGTLEQEGVMLDIIVPDVGPSVGDVLVPGSGFRLLVSNLHCDRLRLDNGAVLEIEGAVTIVCDERLELKNNSGIRLRPGATLTVFTLGRVDVVDQNAYINRNTQDPSRVLWFHTSTEPFSLQENSEIYATIYAPNALVTIDQNGHAYGRVFAKDMWIGNNAGLHVDTATAPNPTVCGTLVDDIEGTKGAFSRGAIQSSSTFRQWYKETPGVNAGKRIEISLIQGLDGMFEFATGEFHPIDDRLYGNEGDSHNWYFTFELPATFVYKACSGQIFSFQGDDDAWLFIDGKLVLDLGGMRPGVPQVIEVDRLGLTDGQTYDLRFFYAQRQNQSAQFRMRTNLPLMPEPYNFGMAGYPTFD